MVPWVHTLGAQWSFLFFYKYTPDHTVQDMNDQERRHFAMYIGKYIVPNGIYRFMLLIYLSIYLFIIHSSKWYISFYGIDLSIYLSIHIHLMARWG